jgi:cytochrome c oxidase subunit II
MPAAVRRIPLTVAPLALVALALAGAATAAGNAGFAPEPGHSPNAKRITDAYWLIFGFTSAIFLIVAGALGFFVYRYRSRGRPRTVEGADVHGHTRLEVIWSVIPVLIVTLIGAFVFYKLPGIKDPPAVAAGQEQTIRVTGHQFYWQFTYPNGEISIQELHLPVGKVANFDITSEDVIHSFWVPQLGGKQDAIPGRITKTWYQPDKIGVFQGRCAEMCGRYHAKMPIRVVSESEADYRTFLQNAPKQLGENEFKAGCQTCHGLNGKGGFGPPLANNPITQQPAAIEEIVRHGRGLMPPVGQGWTDEQMRALTQYLKKTNGGASGG